MATADSLASLPLDMDHARTAAWRGLRRALSLGSGSGSGVAKSGSNRRLSRPRPEQMQSQRPAQAQAQSLHVGRYSEAKDERAHGRQAAIANVNAVSYHEGSYDYGCNNGHSGPNGYDREQVQVPSGPSSPCSLDRFIIDMTFPSPPLSLSLTTAQTQTQTPKSTLTPIDAINKDENEGEDEDDHEITIRSPLHSITATKGDDSPVDPHFYFHSSSSSLHSTHAQPPSPSHTPSPHPSLDDCPILATPDNSTASAAAALTSAIAQSDWATIHHEKDVDIDTYTPTHTNTPPSTYSTPPLRLSTPRGPAARPRQSEQTTNASTSIPRSSSPKTDTKGETTPKPIVLTQHIHATVANSPNDIPEAYVPQQREQSRTKHSMSFGEDRDNGDGWTSLDIQASHPFHQKNKLSVPSSTRTTSTLANINADDVSPPPPSSYLSSSSNSRRNSKLTGFSSSSGSSTYSYSTDASSHRNIGQHWHTERPDISTVFEEDVDLADKDTQSIDQDFAYTQPAQSKSRSLRDNSRYPYLAHQTSSTTLVSRSQSRSQPQFQSRDRSGTISSQAGTIASTRSAGSNKSVHPFANAVLRPSSPTGPSSFLSAPQRPRETLPASKSSPNLADQYSMAQTTHSTALVSTEDDKDDNETCPVCVESLSFTYRLPGEKPHIVPECGHALHEECFVTVYGPVPSEGSKKNLGVCGVCRQPMKIVKGATRDKLAMLMGQSGGSSAPKSTTSHAAPSIRSAHGRQPVSPPAPLDPNADDLIDHGMPASASSRSLNSEPSQPQVVIPSISIRSEFPSIGRGQRKGKQVITAMVTVEIPSAGDRGKYPAKIRPLDEARQLPPSPRSTSESLAIPQSAPTPDPFAHVVNDLRHRMVDYKNSSMDEIGPLRLFDLISVRKANLIREFHVYLFQEALICISEEKKSGFRGIFSSGASVRSDHSAGSMHGRGVLKLKGRIYLKHVKRVIDSSVPGELSLTISMEDESLESFILTFKDRGSHETWRVTIDRLVEESKGGQSKLARLTGAQPPQSASTVHRDVGFNMTSPSSAGYASTPATSMFSSSSPVPGRELTAGDLAYNAPLAPVHTPLDLIIVLSLPAPSSNSQLPLKVKLMKSSLAFVLALLGPRDRVSLVTCEMGVNGIVRKTPYLCTTRHSSRKRLEAFVETLGTGRVEHDEFEVQIGRDERLDVVTAVNVGLDVVLQRKQKNPLSGMVLISDTSDVIKRAQMDLVTARLDAASIPVHALGYGRSHDPSPLWMISNHTNGTYTFVKEWYYLRDSLAGVIGGLMSIALDNMKLHLSCQDNDSRVLKVSGTASAIVSANGKDVDIELRELRHGEIREMLVELDLDSGDNAERRLSDEGSSESDNRDRDRDRGHRAIRKAPSYGLGLETLSVNDSNALRDVVYEDALIDEVPVVEVDCSFHDPAAARSVSRLAHPVLLTVAITPSTSASPTPADAMIVRRRMEILASDMITRALLIASRKNFSHASRILKETKRIIETIVDGLRSHLHAHANGHGNGYGGVGGGGTKSKREAQTVFAIEGLRGTVQDLETLLDGLEEHKEMFERDHRNYSAQQAGVLRAQRSWTTRTITERTYCTREVQQVINLGSEYQSRV